MSRYIFQSAHSLGLMRCFDWDSASNWSMGLRVWQVPLLLPYSVTSTDGASSLPHGLLPCRGLNHSCPTNRPCCLYAGHANLNLNIFLLNLELNLTMYGRANPLPSFLKPSKQWCWHSTSAQTPTHFQISVWREIKTNKKAFFFLMLQNHRIRELLR